MTRLQAFARLVPLLAGVLAGCMTTRVATEYDCDTAVNTAGSTQMVTSYFWGLKQPTDLRPPCDSRFNHLNGVTVKTNFGNYLLAVVTVGVVTRQRVSWCCAPYMPAVDTLGLGPATVPLSSTIR